MAEGATGVLENPTVKVEAEKRQPIVDGGDHMEYMGVRVPKCKDRSGAHVPNPDAYRDYINDPTSLEVQKAIAVSLVTKNGLILEGGSEIGKTKAVKKVASDIGAEVYEVNCHSDQSKAGLERVIADALEPEDGKVKILLLNELNMLFPGVNSYLYEVIDALENGETRVFDGKEMKLDPDSTLIIGTSNTAGKKVNARTPYDEPLMRRATYQRFPDSLPKESRAFMMRSLTGLPAPEVTLSDEDFLTTRETPLSDAEMNTAPGYEDVLDKFIDFQDEAEKLAAELTQGEQQAVFFGARSDPMRVIEFVRRFHEGGDIKATFEKALKFYYGNKFPPGTKRDAMNNLITKTLNGEEAPSYKDELWK